MIISKALAGDQDSSEGKPAHSRLIYNLTVRFMLQQSLAMIVELDKTEAKATKLAKSRLLQATPRLNYC